MGLFDIIKMYKSDWEEVGKRKFEEAECNAIKEAVIVASKYGRSVCFIIPGKGKGFVPLEPIAKGEIGDSLNPRDLELVSLKYVGSDETQVKKNIMRIRIPEKDDSQIDVVNFDNPFGL